MNGEMPVEGYAVFREESKVNASGTQCACSDAECCKATRKRSMYRKE